MEFSKIIVGVMRWGSWGAQFSKNEYQKMIEAALEQNLYTFDHADIYGGYTTEVEFGNAFFEMGIRRENIQLISKCGIEYPGGRKEYSIKSYNYSKDYIIKCAEESLTNLKTDYLDVFLLHRPSPLMDPEEIAAAFGRLRSEGKVLNFGVSNFSPSQFSLVERFFPDLLTNQIEISLTQTKAFEDGTLDQMMMKKIRPLAYSVMGSYFKDENSVHSTRISTLMKNLCEKYSAGENQLMLAFLMTHPSKIVPIVGTSNAETLQKLAASDKILLQREDWFALLECSRGHRVL